MVAVRAFARNCSDARASAASAASDPDDEEYRVWFQHEDRRNMTRINENVTRHCLRGTSFYDDYEIRGAARARHLNGCFFKVTEELAYERKDRDFERECHVEWMDFDCIDALITAEHKLSFKCLELQHAQYEVTALTRTVKELKELKNPSKV